VVARAGDLRRGPRSRRPADAGTSLAATRVLGIRYRAHDGRLRPAWLLGGEGRRLHQYSWGYRGQIDDLARMPRIVEAHGVRIDPSRIYAIGGSIRHDDDDARLWDFTGAWRHTAEMRASTRLPRALARFGLLPWRDVRPLAPAVRLARVLGA
jgi:hypothetical protein